MTETIDGSIACEEVGKVFATSRGTLEALSGVSFGVAHGEVVAVVGPSGCGKSTLLRIVAGLTDATSGRVTSGRLGRPAPRAALVFQEHGLLPWLTVLDNAAFALEARGLPQATRRQLAADCLDRFHLAGFARSYPHELSVGMRQRVAIARAVLADTPVLLMDEPLSALDAQTKLVLQEELLRVWREHSKTVLYVTHDVYEAAFLADRVLVMAARPGRIRQEVLVPLGRPRDPRDRDRSEVRDAAWQAWQAIEKDVRWDLRVPA